MSNYPANRILRFILELVGLILIGQWGWRLSDTPLRFVYAVGLPLLFAAVWLLIASEQDPIYDPDAGGRLPRARIMAPGGARLMLELTCAGFVVYTLLNTGQSFFALVYSLTVLLHTFWSLDRVFIMLELNKKRP